jgi:hypothetical protein
VAAVGEDGGGGCSSGPVAPIWREGGQNAVMDVPYLICAPEGLMHTPLCDACYS